MTTTDTNDDIKQAIEKYSVATQNTKTANEAFSFVDEINTALDTSSATAISSVRVKRESGTTTVSPINNCEDLFGC